MRWLQSRRSSGGVARFSWTAAAFALALLTGCDLVLGIDEVSSANGPDGGQRIQAATADPGPDASTEDAGSEPGTL